MENHLTINAESFLVNVEAVMLADWAWNKGMATMFEEQSSLLGTELSFLCKTFPFVEPVGSVEN